MAISVVSSSVASSLGVRTINALVVAYYQSESWLKLADDSRRTRRPIIERFRVQHGDKRVAMLLPQHIEKMMAAIPRQHARKQWLKAIRHLLQAAVPTMQRIGYAVGAAAIVGLWMAWGRGSFLLVTQVPRSASLRLRWTFR